MFQAVVQHMLCVFGVIAACEIACAPLSFLGFWLFKRLMLKEENAAKLEPEIVVGCLERVFFATAVAFNISGAAVAMIAWTALKAQSRWQVFTAKPVEKEQGPAKLYVSLLGSMLSMWLAMLVGTFAAEMFPPPKAVVPTVNPVIPATPHGSAGFSKEAAGG